MSDREQLIRQIAAEAARSTPRGHANTPQRQWRVDQVVDALERLGYSVTPAEGRGLPPAHRSAGVGPAEETTSTGDELRVLRRVAEAAEAWRAHRSRLTSVAVRTDPAGLRSASEAVHAAEGAFWEALAGVETEETPT